VLVFFVRFGLVWFRFVLFEELQEEGNMDVSLNQLNEILSITTSFNLQYIPSLVEHTVKLETPKEMITFLETVLHHLSQNTILFNNEIKFYSQELDNLKLQSQQLVHSDIDAFVKKLKSFLERVANSVKINQFHNK
jgi:hypothetical protein